MKQLRIGKKNHNYTHPHKPRYASLNHVASAKEFSGSLRVITYNIKLSKKTDKAIQLIAQHEDLMNADIICLQEMDPHGVQLMSHKLGYNYVYYPAILHPRSAKDFGNAILSRWPIIHDEKIILPKLGSGHLQRIAVYATILVGSFRVAVICVHMKMFAKRLHRQMSVGHITASIDPEAQYCIVAGDFNTFSKDNCMAVFESFHEAHFQLVTESVGKTYKYWYLLNKKASLDHIFIRGMSVVHAGKVQNRKPSDHIPIWGELRLSS